MNRVLDPALTACPQCPGWQVPCDTDQQKQRLEEIHAHSKHGIPLPAQPVNGANWQEQAVDAVRQVAARGKNFTLYEALAEFGLADPPNARTALGRFAVLVHDQLICHPIGYAPSQRTGTKKSAAAVWSRDGRRCVEPRCRRRAGAS